MPQARLIRIRGFLEGIEVPVVSAVLDIQPDAPSQCQVQIPATDRSFQFYPRTLIHLFFYDAEGGPDTLSNTLDEPEQVGTSDEQARQDAQDQDNTSPSPSAVRDLPDVPLRQCPSDSSMRSAQQNYGTRPAPTDEELRRSQGSGQDWSQVLPSGGARSTPTSSSPGAQGQVQGGSSPTGAGPVSLPPSDDSQGDEPVLEDRKWKVFFIGEVMGYQFVKTPVSRSIVLQCMDLSVYWDTCYQYQVNVASLTGDGLAYFVGAGTTLFDTFFESAESTIVDIVTRPSRAHPELTGLLAGVVHLLERVGGVYTSNGFRGINDFFSIAELRLRLVDMICAAAEDTSSQRLFPRRVFNDWTRSEGGRLGKIASFREMLVLMMKFIFHNCIPCPIARLVPPSERQRLRTRTTINSQELLSTPEGQRFFNDFIVVYARGREANQLFRERENRLLTNRAMGAQEGNDLIVAPPANSLALNDSMTNAYVATKDGCRRMVPTARALGLNDVATDLEAAAQAAYQVPRTFDANTATEMIQRLNSIREAFGTARRERATTTRTTETVEVTARLNNQILRPDIFMVSPPRCNVIFPELYNSVQHSRQYMREVTRMRMTVSDEIFGPDELLDNWYYAPDVEVLGQRIRQGSGSSMEGASLSRAAFSRRLMEHELFTGVIPVFERMNEVNLYAARSNHIVYRGAQVPYAARAANFQFFKNRLSSGSLSVSGIFNPWIAPGFPCVVIDRHMTEEMVGVSELRGFSLLDYAQSHGIDDLVAEREAAGYRTSRDADVFFIDNVPQEDMDGTSPLDPWLALRASVPTQFLGLAMGVQHSITQNSASTSYTMAAGRTHRERDELLGANLVRLSRREEGQADRTMVVAAQEEDPPVVGQLGPYYGEIIEVRRVQQTGRFMLYGTFGGDLLRRERVEVEVGVTQAARSYGPEVVTITGYYDEEVTFQAYEIREVVDRWRGQRVWVPFEDFVRPPWMSDVWSNPRIGSVYQQFFGTGSITDPSMISTSVGVSSSDTTDNDQSGAEAEARMYSAQDPLRSDSRSIQDAEMDVSVERAVDLLVRAYSVIKNTPDADVAEFIKAYTWRPVADLVDLLGSRDLELDPNTGRATQGTKGMHSLAFGHGPLGTNLRNLIPEGSSEEQHLLLGVRVEEGEDRMNLLTRLDKRDAKSRRVLAYVQELWDSRGLLG